jgi:hypothetical protein
MEIIILALIIIATVKIIMILTREEKFNSPYEDKMTKKSGELCEYPTECESLSCINSTSFIGNNVIITRKCF